jgi:hypothetical protein
MVGVFWVRYGVGKCREGPFGLQGGGQCQIILVIEVPPDNFTTGMKITLKTALACLATLLWLIPHDTSAQSESELRQFLHSTPNTYGWQPVEGDISYDFFEDGRLHVQGADGEATMWGGTWTLEGDQLTLKVPDLKTNKTFTVTMDGDDLLLDGDRYRRYAP